MKDRNLRSLSQAQLGIWFAQMLNANKSLYNIGEAIEFQGPIDVRVFETALRRTVAATDALHLRFIETEDGPRQFLAHSPDWSLPIVDLRGTPDPGAAARNWMSAAMHVPVDLAHEPSFRYALLRVGADRYIWYARYHHLCTDGFGVSLMARRVAALYSRLVSGAPDEAEPHESWFALLDKDAEYEKSAQWRRDQDFWRSQLADRPARVTLAGRSPSWPDDFICSRMEISRVVVEGLRSIAQRHRASLSQMFIAAVADYVHRFTGARDFALGGAVTGRPTADMQRTVGTVSNVVPLPLKIDAGAEFGALLRQVMRRTLEAQMHQRYRSEYLRRDLALAPSEPEICGPVVNVLSFNYDLRFGEQSIRAENLGNWRVDDLEIVIYDRQNGADVSIDFCANPNLYSRDEIAAHQQRFLRLLDALASDDVNRATPLAELLPEEERQFLLAASNATRAKYSSDLCIQTLFEEQVRRSADAVALMFEGEELSYGELNARANRLAHYLVAQGVKPDAVVGLCVERSFDILVGVLGILKAGGAYLPIEPSNPAKRVAYMLEDSGASLVVTQQALVGALPQGNWLFVPLDEPQLREKLSRYPATNPFADDLGLRAHRLAYVIYTSGSTGQPKGVMIEHQNVTRLFEATRQEFEFSERDVWTLFHSYSFDFSVWEIWGALLHGGSLVIVPYWVSRSPSEFHALLRQERVTVLNQTPSAFLPLIEEDQAHERLSSLRTVIFGGEALSLGSLAPWIHRYGDDRPELVNMYGITETTVHVTYRRLRREEILGESRGSVIGRPLRDLSLWVLRDAGDLAPIGVPGEIYVGGAGLARGYLNRPELTQERFIAHPIVPEERLYRTGDLARYRTDGELEYLGRIDQQVKIRGFRIETGEIEAELKKQERVQDALVTIFKRADREELVGYVVAQARSDASAARNHVTHWQQVYDATYEKDEPEAGDFNIVGWNSSYTGEAIPAAEMRLWVQETVRKLEALKPQRAVEIGCGTGLLLTRLAASCESYLGLDFSDEALRHLGTYLRERGDLGHVVLRHGLADELSFMVDDSVDLVVINSVAQYFPGIDYLLRVLAEAVRITRRGGHVFIGDVRSLPLSDAYHTSVQLHKAPPDMSGEELRSRVDVAQQNEEELLIDPALFDVLCAHWEKLGRCDVSPKLENYDNELSRFRYDVALWIGDKQSLSTPGRWLDWDVAGSWRQALQAELARDAQAVICVRGIRDGRAAPAVEAARLLRDPAQHLLRARDLDAAAHSVPGESPADVLDLVRALNVPIRWQGLAADGTYEAIFNVQWRPMDALADVPRINYRRFANAPQDRGDDALESTLRLRLRESLPEYMVPQTIMVLSEWPLTPNGKLDRRALPVPSHRGRDRAGRPGRYRPPETPAEELLAQIWEEALGLDRVGRDENFFDLGGNSLMAMQLFTRIRKTFGKNMPMANLFEAPTIARMALALQRESTIGAWSCLRAIKPQGSRPPLFLVPGIGGNVISFYDLARLLGPEQPVYGLQSRGLDGVEKPISRLRDIAAHFIREVQSVQPDGPYFLGGACIGGVIAFEMAQQLIRAGQEIGLLTLFDAWPPSVHRAAVIPAYMPPGLSVPVALGKGIGRLARTLFRMRPGLWAQHMRGRLKSAKQVVAQTNLSSAESAPLYTDLVSRSNYWAMFKYFPKMYPGKIALFLAAERPIASRRDGRLLWRRFTKQACPVYYVGGKDSGVMLTKPFVAELARKLEVELGRALGPQKAQVIEGVKT